MEKIHWLNFCIPCKSWCCHNENPFTSPEELEKLNVKSIATKRDGSCIFLDQESKCKVYLDRPFECQIFPLDIQEINDELFWVIWTNCLATKKLDYEEIIDFFEKEFSERWPKKYLVEYVKYHKSKQPIKYSKNTFKIIREVNWPTD